MAFSPGSRHALARLAVFPLLVAGCGDSDQDAGKEIDPGQTIRFANVTDEAGIRFDHHNGARGIRHLPETMGGGAAWFDLDRDGDLDLFLLDSGPLPDDEKNPPARNALYQNAGDGTFQDITQGSGDAMSTGYGQGVTAGDFDGDGWVDLYVTNFGPNRLLRNQGDGRFQDVTDKAGLKENGWSCSAAFFDMEGDGDLDLYVVNYLKFSLEDYRSMTDGGRGFLAYAHPDRFRSAPDILYRNEGNGSFTDVTSEAGIVDIDGKGLGVSPSDLDGDGDLDLYVANDSTPNFLFENVGGGRFVDRTVASNSGYNIDGRTEAGMGVAVGDADGDGQVDIFVTNLDGETNTLYLNRGDLYFEDVTRRNGLALDSMVFVGFGTGFFDAELDGDLDLLVANGHIIDNIENIDPAAGSTYRQRSLLFENDGQGQFAELATSLPAALKEPRVVRAAAFADYDNDGDIDVLLAQNAGSAVLLRNDSERVGRFLSLRIVDESGREVPLARAVVSGGDEMRVFISSPGSSYCASGDSRILISSMHDVLDEVLVVWPTGESAKFENVATNRFLIVHPDGTLEDIDP